MAEMEHVLEESLKLLKEKSDEHKFAGLCIAAKYIKENKQENALEFGTEIVSAAGPDFMIRLMTRADESEFASEYQKLAAVILSGISSQEEFSTTYAQPQLIANIFTILSKARDYSPTLNDCVDILRECLTSDNGSLYQNDILFNVLKMLEPCLFATVEPDAQKTIGISQLFKQLYDLISTVMFINPHAVEHVTMDQLQFLTFLFAKDQTELKLFNMSLWGAILGMRRFDTLDDNIIYAIRTGLCDIFRDRMVPETNATILYSALLCVMALDSPAWLVEDPTCSLSVGKFHMLYLNRVVIQVKMLLDEAEEILIDPEHESKRTHDVDFKLEDMIGTIKICFAIIDQTIQNIPDLEPFQNITSESAEMAFSLKKCLDEVMDLVVQFLTLGRDFMQMDVYQISMPLETILSSCRILLSSWMQEESEFNSNILELIPFLVSFQPTQDSYYDDSDDEDEAEENIHLFVVPLYRALDEQPEQIITLIWEHEHLKTEIMQLIYESECLGFVLSVMVKMAEMSATRIVQDELYMTSVIDLIKIAKDLKNSLAEEDTLQALQIIILGILKIAEIAPEKMTVYLDKEFHMVVESLLEHEGVDSDSQDTLRTIQNKLKEF